MAKVERNALLPFTCAQMYRVVNDVASYPRFMKGCRSTEVLSESDDEMVAMLELSKGMLTQKFVTRNKLTPGQRIDMQLEEGPFRSLQGAWTFTELGKSHCKVHFQLQFEMKNALMGMAFSSLLTQVANSMVDTFCHRAHALYGSA
jgi:ribosome-associated toxin RatA of RatAB toxin-antitoxin module